MCFPRTEHLTEDYVRVNINTKIYTSILRAQRELLFSNAKYASPTSMGEHEPSCRRHPQPRKRPLRSTRPLRLQRAGSLWD